MGDMADYFIDIFFDDYDPDLDLEDDMGPPSTLKTCRQCQQKGLHWNIHNGGWRLFNDLQQLHSCKQPTISE